MPPLFSRIRAILLGLACVALTGCCSPQHQSVDPMPAFGPGTRILFQGDSITDGNRGRNTDPNHILGHGYQFLIAARFGESLAERHLVFLNRGISGNKVSDLARRWQAETLDLKPDVLSILIGINDLNAGVSAAEYERQYDQLLTETRIALPSMRLVLGEPFGLPVGHFATEWDKHRADLSARREIVARLAIKHHAALVPYQRAFDDATHRAPAAEWIWDGIHPTYAGHQLMAKEWIRTVRAAWPTGAGVTARLVRSAPDR